MRQRRALIAIVILGAVVNGLIGIVGDVASEQLPPSWEPYLWIAWPVFVLLLALGIVLALREHGEERESGRPFELPRGVRPFAGRARQLGELDVKLHPGSQSMIALVGLPGVGKSALAILAGHKWGDRFKDGVVWVHLRKYDVVGALRHVASTYGYREQAKEMATAEELAALARTALRGREVVLILDNAEQVAGDELPSLLCGGPQCVTLVTSRRSFPELERCGEVLKVEPMVGEDEGDAIELLGGVLGKAEGEKEVEGRQELIERLGGLPLALDIAARQMKLRKWKTAEYLEELEKAPSIVEELALPLAEGPEDGVVFAFALSYESLTDEQRELFLVAGVMAEGGFSPARLAGVLGKEERGVERGLEELEALSLAERSEVAGRYELHSLLTDYSRAVATQEGRWERLRDAHLAHYMVYAEEYAEDYGALEAELGNLMAAAAWSHESGENVSVLGLAKWLYAGGVHFLDLRGHAQEAVQLLRWAVGAAQEIGDRRGEGNGLGSLATAHAHLGAAKRAIEYHEQALAIWREIGERRGEGAGLGNVGSAYHRLGEVKRAIKYYEQALETARELGHLQAEATHLGNLGLACADLGEADQAIRCYGEALGISREVGDRRLEGSLLSKLGSAYADQGKTKQAIGCCEEALAIAQELGDRRGEGVALANLGVACLDLGELKRAVTYHERALAIAREVGDRWGEGSGLVNLGNAQRGLGEVEQAVEHYEQALTIAREIGDRRGEGVALGNLGSAYRRLGEVEGAIEYCEQALAIARETGDQRMEGNALGNLGTACAALGEAERAIECHEQAVAIFEAIGDPNAERARGWLEDLREKRGQEDDGEDDS
jgi:tetratricopeptide (TPR) repeat protein